MKVNYHIHTWNSDGRCTVDEVFARIESDHIEAFAITDHDTTAGIKRARQLSAGKVKFTTGIEFTCAEQKFDAVEFPLSIHLLGYGFDEDHPAMERRLAQRRQEIAAVYESLAAELTAAGCEVHIEDVPISCGTHMQLKDVSAYVERKYGPIRQSMDAIIDPYHEKLSDANVRLQEAVAVIHAAGGQAVWAHPFDVYRRFGKTEISRSQVAGMLGELKEIGIDGIEAEYAGFCEEDRKWLWNLAKTHGLFVTVGSDFHGGGGRSQIGMEVTAKTALILIQALNFGKSRI